MQDVAGTIPKEHICHAANVPSTCYGRQEHGIYNVSVSRLVTKLTVARLTKLTVDQL